MYHITWISTPSHLVLISILINFFLTEDLENLFEKFEGNITYFYTEGCIIDSMLQWLIQ